MAAPPDTAASWVMGVLGLFSALYAGAIGLLFSQMGSLRAEQRMREGGLRADNLRDSEKLWEAIDGMRKELSADRALAATDRANIAGTMVTRAELERQIDKLITAFTVHGRMQG